MNVPKKTIMPFEGGSIKNIDIPVIPSIYATGPSESYGTVHKHVRGQLIYPESGPVKVKTEIGVWLISPQQAAWIPPMEEHQLQYLKETSIYCLFIDRHYCKPLNKNCSVYNANSLLHELIKKAAAIGSSYNVNSHEYRIMQVILGEIKNLTPSTLSLPLAKDERILRVMNYLIKHPSTDKQMDYFSKLAYTSSRNLNRLFLHETGMTLGIWRKHLIVIESIEKLSRGVSVTEVSLDMGYNSLSSFVNMFRKTTGKTPGAFLDKKRIIKIT